MKKLLNILLLLFLFSCSGNCDSLEEVSQNFNSDLEPSKIWTYYAELPIITTQNPDWYYQFSYENGLLKRMNGKLYKMGNSGFEFYTFSQNVSTNFSYSGNQIVVEYSENDAEIKKSINTLESGRIKKSESFDEFNNLIITKNYSYETDKISVHTKRYTFDTYDTYFFDSNKNLIKSEKLQVSSNIQTRLTTTQYLNFDQAKNPYKKLYIVNDNFFIKSLSENNFRKITYITQNLQYPELNPGSGYSEWTYQYDADGQVILYHQ
ncbi:hypothetical protein CHRY9390_00820 [Chryseobacterium aquaeductus]|uniref:YD repeat-containing protein n=1 Tax=Chryseobacterium aquaeductus TaxID=2675056 RepID=A0A9N8ME63_9FLAO|nr:hypothetical protein [Chryseobacterium aquaeductus]CAA7330166.1 hypothetical protein CHRY9390_00820 [Chryseobacterium potabilaquae]CAD7801735.1 hypothetical protein CHRY9390_00820 [Chryseobacterium aquaeductus]